MRNLLTTVLMVFLFSVVGFASETVKGAKKDLEAFKKEMAVKLDAAEQKIAELRTEAKVKGSAAQEKLATELEVAKDGLKKQQANLKYESESSWKKMKQSLSEAADNLNSKIQSALKE